MSNVFTKRNFIGGLLFLLLVGELNVGGQNGLFTPIGIVVLGVLYFLYFILLESLISRYNLNNLHIVLVNFALYSVIITGLLHGELADYVLIPDSALITTLIRIQCSLYPLFAFYLLRKLAPRTHRVTPPKVSVLLFVAYMGVVSFSGSFGVGRLVGTFQAAPLIATGFAVAAGAALMVALRQHKKQLVYRNATFGILAAVLLVVSLVPGLPAFLLLLALMIATALLYVRKSDFRNSSVV